MASRIRPRKRRKPEKSGGKHQAEAATLAAQALVHAKQNNPAAAARLMERAVRLAPDNAEYHNNLAVLLRRAGRLSAAMAAAQRAARLAPQDGRIWTNLGNLRRATGDLDGAQAAYRRATTVAPDLAPAAGGLAMLLRQQGDLDGALDACRRAWRLAPGDSGIRLNLATTLHLAGRLTEAHDHLAELHRQHPDDPAVANNLANLLLDLGRQHQALALYRRAAAEPASPFHSSWLLARHYLEDDPAALLAAHRQWAEGLGPVAVRPPLPSPAPGDKIRVAYLSGDFRRHPVACFIEPILAHHDRRRFEIFCYHNNPITDPVGEHLATLARFRPVFHLGDDEAAALIRKDKIHILVDLAGHTHRHRLGILARRPAPVQATWIGYPDTTGLAAVDYRITDTVADPDDDLPRAVEHLDRLPPPFLVFQPAAAPPVAKTATANRPLTFGSCNAMAKITGAVLDLWARLLQALPDAVLAVKNRSLGDPTTAAGFRQRLADRGIEPERVRCTGFLPDAAAHLAFYNDIDIALDTFPYNGTTTTCEALWMGTPVVTLAGRHHAGRVGASLLTAMGRREWIAGDEDHYLEICRRLAGDVATIRATAPGLRDQFAASPLMDHAGFCRRLEDRYLHWLARLAEPPVTA